MQRQARSALTDGGALSMGAADADRRSLRRVGLAQFQAGAVGRFEVAYSAPRWRPLRLVSAPGGYGSSSEIEKNVGLLRGISRECRRQHAEQADAALGLDEAHGRADDDRARRSRRQCSASSSLTEDGVPHHRTVAARRRLVARHEDRGYATGLAPSRSSRPASRGSARRRRSLAGGSARRRRQALARDFCNKDTIETEPSSSRTTSPPRIRCSR